MNAETKRHIDAARQVLVGVVPNPTSQIDQITYALIYKFMDDMDQSAIKSGDEPAFFTGDLELYSWARLMDTRLGNQERMDLYVMAFQRFSESKQLPELFRGILKSAYLPYRSPETLWLFLKEIDYFDYSHPEELGNAYEYLLSIMSSQGDAGQFRTPRHLIDFIVRVVNPTKDDKVLDPACGTGGFLVSAYKYILEQHDGKNDPKKKEKQLTPDERKKLMKNFEGYDIDPGMVRIAEVNMYLHQFKSPKIFQYDSLSSAERWGDKFDVILANPPFMSPKGGIKPHSKFSIPSSRSEVLFVDYIMNHLRPKGRAGIIVPEGIIFQSGTAYKELRKNLVNDGLYAVVSLPSGVFNPYAGVKTSVLFFDNEIAKQRSEILFVKIEKEGYDLGAQRRPLCDDNGENSEWCPKHSDFPLAVEALEKWRTGKKIESKLILYVEKKKITENGDYNLSGSRFAGASRGVKITGAWPMVKLGDVCDVYQPKTITSSEIKESGNYKVFGANGVIGYFDKYNHEEAEVAVTCRGATCGTVNFTEPRSWITGNAMVIKPKENNLNKRYLFFLLRNTDLSSVITGAAQPQITGAALKPFLIPFPPLGIQEQIVAELDGYQNIVSGAKQIIQNWKPKIDIDPKWEKVKLKSVCVKITDGSHNPPKQASGGGYFMLSSQNIFDGYVTVDKAREISKEDFDSEDRRTNVQVADVLLTIVGTIGRTTVVTKELPYRITLQRSVAVLKTQNNLLSPEFLSYILRTDELHNEIINQASGVAQKGIYLKQLGEIIIPLPPLEIQKKIVEKIEVERVLVESNKKLIEIYEQKMKETIAKLWSK